MITSQLVSSDKIMKVLKKMDEVLTRKGIYQYQERMVKIHKILLTIERHNCSKVSNFSAHNFEDKEKQQKEKGDSKEKSNNKEEFFIPLIEANNLENAEGQAFDSLDENQIRKKLEDLLEFVEAELYINEKPNIYSRPDSKSPNKQKFNLTFYKLDKKFDTIEGKEIFNFTANVSAENSSVYTSASPKKRDLKNIGLRKQENICTFTKSESLASSLFQSKNLKNKFLDIELRIRAYLKESNHFFKTKSIENFLKEDKQQSQKENDIPDFDKFNSLALNSGKSSNKIILQNKENLTGNKERIDSNNLQKSNISSIYTKSNFNTVSSNVNSINSSIPTIYKNFFEEKDFKDLNRKRHSMAVADLLNKNKLKKNFSNAEMLKQKYQSNNHRGSLDCLNRFLENKGYKNHDEDSKISDFSLNIHLKDNDESFDLQENDGDNSNNIKKATFELLKMRRNSIFNDRLIGHKSLNHVNFETVEEEKIAISDNSNNASEDEKSF